MHGRFAALISGLLTMSVAGAIHASLPASAATATTGRLPHGELANVRAARLLSAAPGSVSARPAVPRVAGFSCDSQFHVVSGANPSSAADVIVNNAIAAVAPSDIWAVGSQVSGVGQSDRTLADHWDGFTWAPVTTPNPGVGNNDLWGVTTIPGATVSANSVWAVGDYTDPLTVEHPLAIQWNGSGWNLATPPSVGSGDSRLLAVVAVSATNIWAVGFSKADNNAGTPSRTLVEHYDGATWTVVSSPDSGSNSSDQLLSVAATSATDLWAVGRSISAGVTQTLIEHYNGTAWSIVTSPNVSPTENTLYGVAALSPSSAWAVGDWADGAGRRHTNVLTWDGASWTTVSSPTLRAGAQDNALFSVSAVTPRNVWAVGAVYSPSPTGNPSDTLVEHWDGTRWNVVPSPDGATGSFNELNAVTTAGPNVWVAGDYVNTAATEDLTLFENLCIPMPDVFGVSPQSGNAAGGTTVTITGSYFTTASAVSFGGTGATSFTIDSDTQITAVTPAEPSQAASVTVTTMAGTTAPCYCALFAFVPSGLSWQQYRLTGSDGVTWKPIDAGALTVSFTPTVDSNAVLGANADLWTASAGVNQDLGIFVSGGAYGVGQLVGWKEGGGNGGTFSPNAAFVQAVVAVKAATAYTATLEWKANHPTTGSIFVAAGASAPFSPTQLTVELVAASDPNLQTVASTQQYSLSPSDGSTWQTMDGSALTMPFTPSVSGSALLGVNADLWTENAGVNQDLGIFISGGAFGSGQIVGWKESGGYAGTFSPNAAYAQTVVPLAAATPYVIKVEWKANHATSGRIRAGAGLGPTFSPTRLTLRMFPGGTGLQDASSTQQYHIDGQNQWQTIDYANLVLHITPTSDSVYMITANADLWTDHAGLNQDLAVIMCGGVYGCGRIIGWKESGGFAGTFSPNAAFLQTLIPLQSGVHYDLWLISEGNHFAAGSIFFGAGPDPGPYSPTRITAQRIS